MKRLGLLLLAVVFVFSTLSAGCSKYVKPDTVPGGCEQSLVYQNVPYADIVGGVLVISGYEAFKIAKAKGVDVAPVISAVNQTKAVLGNATLTYPQLVIALANMSKYIKNYAGVELTIAVGLVEQMVKTDLTINACDRTYFVKNMEQFATMLALL